MSVEPGEDDEPILETLREQLRTSRFWLHTLLTAAIFFIPALFIYLNSRHAEEPRLEIRTIQVMLGVSTGQSVSEQRAMAVDKQLKGNHVRATTTPHGSRGEKWLVEASEPEENEQNRVVVISFAANAPQ